MDGKKERIVKIGALQPGPNTENIEQNRQELLKRIDSIAESEHPDFLLLGELAILPYIGAVLDTKYFEWAETIPGPTTEAFGEKAKKHGMCILVGIFEKAPYEGVYYNSLVALGPDGKIIEGIFPAEFRFDRKNVSSWARRISKTVSPSSISACPCKSAHI